MAHCFRVCWANSSRPNSGGRRTSGRIGAGANLRLVEADTKRRRHLSGHFCGPRTQWRGRMPRLDAHAEGRFSTCRRASSRGAASTFTIDGDERRIADARVLPDDERRVELPESSRPLSLAVPELRIRMHGDEDEGG